MGTWWGRKSVTQEVRLQDLVPKLWLLCDPGQCTLLSRFALVQDEEVCDFRWWVCPSFVCCGYLKIYLPTVSVRLKWKDSCKNASYLWKALQIVIILHDHHQYRGSWRKSVPWKEEGFGAVEEGHGQFWRRTGIWTLQRASQEGTSQLIRRRVAGKEDPESRHSVTRMLDPASARVQEHGPQEL